MGCYEVKSSLRIWTLELAQSTWIWAWRAVLFQFSGGDLLFGSFWERLAKLDKPDSWELQKTEGPKMDPNML